MKVLRPTIVTPEILSDSSIAETDHPAWAGAPTSYALAARVIRDHVIWESAVADNVGNDPLTEAGAQKWTRIGATNRWRMFDQAAGSLSASIGSIEVELEPGRIGALAVLEVTAKQVTVTVRVGADIVYGPRTQSTAAGGRAIENLHQYFFAPIGVRRRLLFDDLPAYRDAIVTVTIEGTTETSPVSVGTLILGRMFDIGTTLTEPNITSIDYSVKVRDGFGGLSFVPRGYIDSVSYQVMIRSARTDTIRDVMAELRNVPTLWIGADRLDALFTYGIAANFSIVLANLDGTSVARLDTEGLV